jgi:DNA repair exonuclease SbcCD ATPase subunit
MFKKLLVIGLVAAASVAVLKGTKFFGYAKHEMHAWRESIEDRIPVETKIAQMRKDVGALDKDIERVAHELAREIVEVREKTHTVAVLRAGLETEQKGLLARAEELKDATEHVKLGGRFVTVPEAKERLKKDVDLHLKKKQSLESQEKALASHERIKETLKKQLDSMMRQKDELKAEIDNVEAQYKELQLQQVESKFQTDDSRLAKIKESLHEMQKKLDIEKEKLALTQKIRAEEPTAAAGQTVDEIIAPLASKTGEKIEKAAK